jgi:ribose transport system permease protein
MEKLWKGKKIDVQAFTLYFGGIVILLAFTILCQLKGKDFFSLQNIMNIIQQSAIIGITGIGASIVILTGGIDLSVGSVIAFVGISGGMMLKAGIPLPVTVLLCMVCGILIGLFNGYFVTLGSMQIFRGFTKVLTDGKPVSGFDDSLAALTSGKFFGVPALVYYVFILYAIMIFITLKTKFGRRLYAIGGNSNAAKLSGVKIRKIEISAYAIAGLFFAIGGICLLSRLSYADPNAGSGYEMDAIAATVLGGIALSGGKGKVGNTLVGALVLGILKSGLQILNVATYWQTVIIGVVIILAVYADKSNERKAE